MEIKDYLVRKWKIQSLSLRNQQDRSRGKRRDESKKQRDGKEARIAVGGETFGNIEVERKETPED